MFELDKVYTHWSWERLYRHLVYWSFWLLLYATVNTSNNPHTNFGNWLVVESCIMLAKLPFVYTMIYVLVPQFLIKRRYLPFFFWAISGATAGGILICSLYYFRLAVLAGYPQPTYFWSPSIIFKILDLLYVSAFPTIYKLYQYYRQEESNKQKMIEQSLSAELELLKNQLQPHFLFNTLNNLYGLILTHDPNAAPAMLRLSSIMSYMLYECNSPFIRLEKETEHLKAYIELEKIRYGKRLDVSFEYGGSENQDLIAPLLLIGFVENAFKHGMANEVHTAWIRINIWVDNGQLEFLVENSVPAQMGEKETFHQKSGIGLSNIQKRLQLIYPEKHTLKIAPGDGTFLIHLQLNLNGKHA